MMIRFRRALLFISIVVGTVAGMLWPLQAAESEREPREKMVAGEAAEVAALREELKELRKLLPGEKQLMIEAAYHYANLWFAAEAGNWPLAESYANETRGRLRAAIRIKPVKKLKSGDDVRLDQMLAGIEAGAFKDVQASIKAGDRPQFVAAYQTMLASCNACHAAVDKPLIRLKIPVQPAEPLMDFSRPE